MRLAERQKPIQDQQGAVQCGICKRWFRSRGSLAVHRRKGPTRNNQQDPITNLASSLVEDHVTEWQWKDKTRQVCVCVCVCVRACM